jgi:DNA-binding response OmpR family regulator
MSSDPPRVLLIMPDQWPRALLRAALREAGYDALGAPGLAAALHYRAEAPGRGLVRLVVVDQAVLADHDAAALLGELGRRHGDPGLVLLARAGDAQPIPGAAAALGWRHVLRRPTSIAELVAAVQTLLPLPPESARPLD